MSQPKRYIRTTLRASWSAQDLEEAMRCVESKEMGVNEASRHFGIPSRTLRRHLLTGKTKGPLGRHPVFNSEYEKKLVTHIQKLEKVGFAPDRKDVKEMAFQLAKTYNIRNPFSEKTEAAGNIWFNGFLARNPVLSQRKSEGLSLARAHGVNRKDVKDFFDLLAKIYQDYDFASHPEDIYNMDESGIQINNKPGKVIATKGAKDVYTLTSHEKGENVTVIACCNAQGNFIPPVLIYKGAYSKPQFAEGLPPGSQVFMNKKSSYINSDLFLKWFNEVFLRHKNPRRTLLVLDGHSSHSNNIHLLEVAKENDVILLCLPSHTTHALQPLDRCFFGPLKVYFAQEAKSWMVRNKDKKLTRYDVSKLIGIAWGKAATIPNGISALKSCGIYPYDPNAIPEHYFSLSDSVQNENLTIEIQEEQNETLRPIESPSTLVGFDDTFLDNFHNQQQTSPSHHVDLTLDKFSEPLIDQRAQQVDDEFQFIPTRKDILNSIYGISPTKNRIDGNIPEPQPGPSGITFIRSVNKTPVKAAETCEIKETPSKILSEIHPVPKLPMMSSKRKQTAIILTSPENIQKRKVLDSRKKGKIQNKETKTNQIKGKQSKGKKGVNKNKINVMKSKKKKRSTYTSSESSDGERENKIDTSDDEISDEDVNRCVECTENYFQTKSTEDWIQCTSCSSWLHEFCTMYNPMCNRCGRNAKRESMKK